MFEYRIEPLWPECENATAELLKLLNGLGEFGWELVAVLPPEDEDAIRVAVDPPRRRYVFRRAKRDGRQPQERA